MAGERARSSACQRGRKAKKSQFELPRLRSLSVGTVTAPILIGNKVEINPKNCPNAKITGILFENHYHLPGRSRSVDADEDDKREHLLESLAAYYDRDDAWLVLPWDDKVRFSSDDFCVGLRVQTMDKSGNLATGDPKKIKNLLEPLPKTKAAPKILVRGNPSFGKTTICNRIARDWSKRSKTFTGYPEHLTVVLYLKLKYLTGNSNLENELIKLALQKETFTTNDDDYLTILKLLKLSGRYIVILLDGYDEVDVHLKLQVKELLKCKPHSIFKGASMIVTCRPNDDTELLTLVHGQFILKSLSEKSSLKLIKRYFRGTDEYCATFYNKNVKHLQQEHLSPLLLLMLCYCRNLHGLDLSLRTSDLYRRLIFLIAKSSCKNMNLSEEEIKDKLHKLGEFFWMCLERRQTVFSLDKLDYYLRNDSKFSLNCGLIRHLEERNCEPVHVILMETLAGAYLEKSCLSHASTRKMTNFIRYNFRDVPSLNMYYYTDQECKVTFRLDFDYRGFRFSYKILQNGEEKCTMLMNNLLESWDVNERHLCLSFRTCLSDRNKDTILEVLPQVFPDHPLPRILSDFMSSSVFSNLCLKFIIDCESDTNMYFTAMKESHKTNAQIVSYEPCPLLPLRNIADELILNFLKPSCTPETILAVLRHLAIYGGTPCIKDALEFLKCLQCSSCSPNFVVAHLHSCDAYAKVSSSVVTTNINASPLSWFIWGPDFSWHNCNRIEILFRKDVSGEHTDTTLSVSPVHL